MSLDLVIFHGQCAVEIVRFGRYNFFSKSMFV